METQTEPIAFPKQADKKRLREVLREVEKELGIEFVPNVDVKALRESMIRSGIRPEDRIFSRDIIRMRYGTDEDEE